MRVTVLMDGCMVFSTIQISNELLTFLAEKPNHWCQKTQPCKWTREAVKHIETFSVWKAIKTKKKLLYHPVLTIPPVPSSMIPFYLFWLVSLSSSPHCHLPGKHNFKTKGFSYSLYLPFILRCCVVNDIS